MLVQARPEISALIRYLVVAMVLVVGVLGLAACAEGLCSECTHSSYNGADLTRPLLHLGRKVGSVGTSAVSLALVSFPVASRGFRLVVASFVPVPALLRASSLRI